MSPASEAGNCGTADALVRDTLRAATAQPPAPVGDDREADRIGGTDLTESYWNIEGNLPRSNAL